MASARATHALIPETHRDRNGRRWCVRCYLPEDNAVHELAEVIDLTKARIDREERDAEIE